METLILIVLFVAFLFLLLYYSASSKDDDASCAPPIPASKYPIIGHLHLIAKYSNEPWKAFDSFREKYGDVVQLKLGLYDAVLVSSSDAMKEVLFTKGDIFADRPDFYRYHLIFGGSRENALALCDWSDLQLLRRNITKLTTMPKRSTRHQARLTQTISSEWNLFYQHFLSSTKTSSSSSSSLSSSSLVLRKEDVGQLVTNAFADYMCGIRFDYDNPKLKRLAYNFDYIFWDINQCYSIDFIPFLRLLGIHRKELKELKIACESAREFVEKEFMSKMGMKIRSNITNENKSTIEIEESSTFMEFILQYHYTNPDKLSWLHTLYVVGDLVGGSSAVLNTLWRIFGHLALNLPIQEYIYDEIKQILDNDPSSSNMISFKHCNDLVYTEAVYMETLRMASSPIVPHVPTQDTTIQGFKVAKGSMILFNNYHLNTSTQFWKCANTFYPQNFLASPDEEKKEDNGNDYANRDDNGNDDEEKKKRKTNYRLKKPDIFFPFSFGKRSCLGQKLVRCMSIVYCANLIREFQIKPLNSSDDQLIRDELSPKCLALKPSGSFQLQLIRRENRHTNS